jgi:hypothetical protein
MMAGGISFSDAGQMGITCGGGWACMAENILDMAQT